MEGADKKRLTQSVAPQKQPPKPKTRKRDRKKKKKKGRVHTGPEVRFSGPTDPEPTFLIFIRNFASHVQMCRQRRKRRASLEHLHHVFQVIADWMSRFDLVQS
jgi:hypothetical protein